MPKKFELNLRGAAGNLIFYKRGNNFYVRARPKNVKQSNGMRTSSSRFGDAVSISRLLRQELRPLFPYPKNRAVIYNMDRAVRGALDEISQPANDTLQTLYSFRHLNLGGKAFFEDRFKIPISINWNIPAGVQIGIPELIPAGDISAPQHTELVLLQLTAVVCRIGNRSTTGVATTQIAIPYSAALFAEKDIMLPVKLEPGSIAVLAAALKYTVNGKELEATPQNDAWLPAGVVEAVYKGE